MKKLMMFAAAAVVAGSVSAITIPDSYTNECGTAEIENCSFIGFDFKESGKLAQESAKKGYKTIQSFSAKGAIGLVYGSDTNCCDAPASITMIVKTKLDGVTATYRYDNLGITRLSFFGKNIEKVDANETAGKYYSVDSDLGWCSGAREAVDAAADYCENDANTPTFIYSGFGKAKMGLTKGTKAGTCGGGTEGCDPDVIFQSYKGWFAGYYPIADSTDVKDYSCESGCDWAIYGGTWSAKYNKKYTKLSSITTKYPVACE